MASNGIIDLNDKNYHLGHYFLHWTKQQPDEIFHIDAATGASETNAQVLTRSIELANCFRNIGLKPGDVIAMSGKNHLDLHIPLYAGLLNGLPIAGVDPFFERYELKSLFSKIEPKIAFCQSESYEDYKKVVDELGLDTKIVTYGKLLTPNSYKKFVKSYSFSATEEFKPAEFDTDKVYAWLVSTSGTTGLPKVAAFKHKTIIMCFELVRPYLNRAGKRIRTLNLSASQWISSYITALHVVVNSTKIQSSEPATVDHAIDIINKYKPSNTTSSPNLLCAIVNSQKYCDMTCFDIILSTGGKMSKEYIPILKSKLRKGAVFCEMYGQTETLGPTLNILPFGPDGNCGTKMEILSDIKLMDLITGKEITEANVTGELFCKSRFSFCEYYNDPEETKKAFDDGWFKTGDLLYRDEAGIYYYVDRMKALIKYKRIHVYPGEIESVIRTLDGVQDVCVTGIIHAEDGEHPVACVVKTPGSTITEDDVKNIVKNNMSDKNQLRGGVIFLEEMPETSTGKIARLRLKELVRGSVNGK